MIFLLISMIFFCVCVCVSLSPSLHLSIFFFSFSISLSFSLALSFFLSQSQYTYLYLSCRYVAVYYPSVWGTRALPSPALTVLVIDLMAVLMILPYSYHLEVNSITVNVAQNALVYPPSL